jgi:hypothetical protein
VTQVSLDVLCSLPHYAAHLEPVWASLPAQLRGRWHPQARRGSAPPDGAVLVASAHDLGLAVRAGYRRVAYLEHGAGQSYGQAHGYPGGKGRGPVDLFLSPGPLAAAADRAAYPAARVVEVGSPVLELLPAREPGPPAVAVSFHWPCGVAPEAGTALPHYRRALAGLAERYPLLGHGHPKAARELERLWRGLGVEYVPSWHEVLRRADAYVCDNSSTLFEFASTGRPVVVLNAPWWRRSVSYPPRFWQAASVGVQVEQPGELEAAVALALEDRPGQRRARRAALRLVYARRRGAAQAAARALEEWLA